MLSLFQAFAKETVLGGLKLFFSDVIFNVLVYYRYASDVWKIKGNFKEL